MGTKRAEDATGRGVVVDSVVSSAAPAAGKESALAAALAVLDVLGGMDALEIPGREEQREALEAPGR